MRIQIQSRADPGLPGVIDQQIETAKARRRFSDQRSYLLGPATSQGKDGALAPQLLHQGLTRFAAAGRQDDLCTLAD